MNQLLTSIIPYIVPTVLIVVGYFCHLAISYIPAQQRAYLMPFVQAAVAMVEQKFANQSDEQKKAFAMDATKAFFKAFNLPCPPDDVLSAFIEAAVNALENPLQGGKTA